MIEEKTDSSKAVDAAKESRAAAAEGERTVMLKIYSPFKTFFDEPAYSISAQNATGPFDILPMHHNFMTLLSPGELKIKPVNPTSPKRIRISGGLMHVKADKITIFLDV